MSTSIYQVHGTGTQCAIVIKNAIPVQCILLSAKCIAFIIEEAPELSVRFLLLAKNHSHALGSFALVT